MIATEDNHLSEENGDDIYPVVVKVQGVKCHYFGTQQQAVVTLHLHLSKPRMPTGDDAGSCYQATQVD